MSVDFFLTPCKEPSRTDKLFGLCDDQNGEKAYSNITDTTKWIARVINDNDLSISFTSIDNCIIVLKEGTKDKESTCDGMLLFAQDIYLVELKNVRVGGWLSQATQQLENTIRLISEYHPVTNFKHKKAYACNRRHPYFTIIDVAERNAFFHRTKGFRIDAQAEIVIK